MRTQEKEQAMNYCDKLLTISSSSFLDSIRNMSKKSKPESKAEGAALQQQLASQEAQYKTTCQAFNNAGQVSSCKVHNYCQGVLAHVYALNKAGHEQHKEAVALMSQACAGTDDSRELITQERKLELVSSRLSSVLAHT